jgi:hypothetical protein
LQQLCRLYTISDDDDSKSKVDRFDDTHNFRVEHFSIRGHLNNLLIPSSTSGLINFDSFHFPGKLFFPASFPPRQVFHPGKLSTPASFSRRQAFHAGKLFIFAGKLFYSAGKVSIPARFPPRQVFHPGKLSIPARFPPRQAFHPGKVSTPASFPSRQGFIQPAKAE